ncbi:MAG: hypothetical protein JWP49_2641 [Phenylobacterium sp.]|nr:hypothetical protein [Phenylobacterium sp.]
MDWIDAIRLRRAAGAYARKLPNHLARAYGRGSSYTPGQIRRAVTALKLDPAFICVGLAAFLDEAEYLSLKADLLNPLEYTTARAAFIRRLPARVNAGSWDNANSSGAYVDGSGGDVGGHGHGGHH